MLNGLKIWVYIEILMNVAYNTQNYATLMPNLTFFGFESLLGYINRHFFRSFVHPGQIPHALPEKIAKNWQKTSFFAIFVLFLT